MEPRSVSRDGVSCCPTAVQAPLRRGEGGAGEGRRRRKEKKEGEGGEGEEERVGKGRGREREGQGRRGGERVTESGQKTDEERDEIIMVELETSHDVGVQNDYGYNSVSNPGRARIRMDIYSLKITYAAYKWH